VVDTYRTLATGPPVSAQIEVKRSRFVGVVGRVSDEDEAQDLLARQRSVHHAARHHCSAYVLGPDGARQRSSDDGEPSGTAGQPILDVLTGRGLSDVVAVVTRYFGGTLLGAGGLVRAYSDAVAVALEQASYVRRRRLELVRLAVPMAEAGRLEAALRGHGFTVDGVEYAEDATFTVGTDAPARVAEAAARLLGRPVATTATGHRWIDEPADDGPCGEPGPFGLR